MEVIRDRKKFLPEFAENSDLHSGDIERVDIEEKLTIFLIAFAPPLKLPRWLELQKMARQNNRGYGCIRAVAGFAGFAIPTAGTLR